MAKLPDIEYGPTQRSSDTATLPYDAARGAAKVISEGLTMWGQELVKTKMQRASVRLSEQLEEIDTDLSNRPYVSRKELEEALGDDVEKLPPHLKAQLEVKDPATGEMVDNDQIPMWAAFGPLYDRLAKRALEASASDIPMRGWQTEFKGKAQETVLARKARLNERQMKAALEYMKASQKSDINAARNSARTPEEFAAARAMVMRSGVFDPAEKKAELDATDEAEQLRPVLDASTANDPDAMRAQITRLEAGGADVDRIKPEHRNTYVKALRSQLEAREREKKEDADKQFKENERVAWGLINAKQDELRRGRRRLTSAEYSQLIPRPDTVRHDEWRQMDAALAALAKPPAVESDAATYWNVTQSFIQDPEAYREGRVTIPGKDGKPVQVSLYSLQDRLKRDDFDRFVDLMRSAAKNEFVYRGAITDQEAINAALADPARGGYDLKTKDEAEQKEIVHLSSLINNTLAARAQAKGSALDQGERDLVIAEVMDREVKTKKNSWLWRQLPFTDDQERTVRTLGVRPEIAVALYEGTASGGRRMEPDEVVAAATEYAKFEPGILAAWKRYAAGKPLAPDVAVHVFYLVNRDRALLDESLKGQLTGDEAKDNLLRAAQATRGYLQKGIR